MTRYLTDKKDISVPRRHLQKLEVVGVETRMYGHAPPAMLHLVATTQKGDRVLVPNRIDLFYEEDPVKESWGEELGRMIRQGRIRRGMTTDMVRLSWGDPQRVKKSGGDRERWLYASGEHVDFEDGIMVGGRASR